MLIRRVKSAIDSHWAKHGLSESYLLATFLVFMTSVSFFTVYVLHQYNPIYGFILVLAMLEYVYRGPVLRLSKG